MGNGRHLRGRDLGSAAGHVSTETHEERMTIMSGSIVIDVIDIGIETE